MIITGAIHKMISIYKNPIQYYLNLDGNIIDVNTCIGKQITISHIGYKCISCGVNEKSFRMGFCKKCFFESPMANESILKPELSTAHLGIEQRDLAFEQQLELQPHTVYLSYTSDLKVGVTRNGQVPTRWIDQGALEAVVIAETQNRYEAGCIEVALKEHLADKTHWKKMLENSSVPQGVFDVKNDLLTYFPNDCKQFFLKDTQIWSINYPCNSIYNLTSINLDKSPKIEGVLSGIKGQYLLFDDGKAFNIRSAEGHVVKLEL